MAEYYVYILYSESYDKYYIGYTGDLEKRLEKHNARGVKSTKPYVPWQLVYRESFDIRRDAIAREKQLKSWKSKVKIRELVATSR